MRRFFLLHPRASDWLVVALYAVGAAVGGLGSTSAGAEPPGWLVLVAVAVAGVLLARRRRPVLVAAVVTLLGAGSILLTQEGVATDTAAAFAMYAVAAQRRPRVAWATLGGVVAVLGGATLVAYQVTTFGTADALVAVDVPFGRITGDRVASTASLIVIVVLGFAIGTSVRSRRLHVTELIDRSVALEREGTQRAELAAAQERARIAREMHDVVAHSLTVMVALADGAKALGAKDPALAGQAIDELTETGRSALADMRRVLGVLRGTEPGEDGAPLVPHASADVEQTVETFRHAGLPVRLVRSGTLADAPPGVRAAVHRIVTESLTNVLRYAPLSPAVQVVIGRHPAASDGSSGPWVEVTVTNAAGAAPSAAATRTPGSGRGILGMRERAALHGGTVEAGPTDAGWKVRAVLPEGDVA
ncbi:MYXO-CTERM domain-containing protein [Sediminihabitans luteus]|uniref:histidine kinase n=1 Tax=Sediminihabitans luteus TaxID=1138585 RepID=A0A2M9CDA0_9CELL|nr:histidine kinase [Sediminihabitans luteus]PJJ69904.1 MYXO-CTERM domain-containing protein [Sediminihabitans luteus]GII99224.1 hypothetical protein Slu03_16020 [Sediminihabitans luteus]